MVAQPLSFKSNSSALPTTTLRINPSEPMKIAFLGSVVLYQFLSLFYSLQDSLALTVLVPGMLLSFSATAILLTSWQYRYEVSARGLRSVGPAGRSRLFHWNDLEQIHQVSVLGMDFLRISSARSRAAMWVPLFMAGSDALVQLLESRVKAQMPAAAVKRIAA
jgi:hypothetical protein